jgi:hypothetical protein
MSKHETPMTRWYWEKVGGLLVKEFPLVGSKPFQGKRHLDGLIVLDEPKSISDYKHFDITGKDVMVIQAKAKRLGMYLMGQCLFSRDLVMQLGARTVRSVAIGTKDDSALRPLLEAHAGCEVVVYEGAV